MTEEIREVYDDFLRGRTAHEVWTTPKLDKILAAVMTKLGQPLEKRGCLSCIFDALKALRAEIEKTMEGKYKMKNVMIGRLGFPLQNDNLTDDLARKLLAKFPEDIRWFKVFPIDWRIDCGLDKPVEVAIEKESIKEEAPKKTVKRKKKAD